MPLQLLDLPEELLLYVVECISEPEIIDDSTSNYKDEEECHGLHAVRLSCRKLSKITTAVLFRELRLSTDDKSVEAYTSVLTHETYRTHVRRFAITLEDEGERESDGEGGGERETSEGFDQALSTFNELPNLNAVTLLFSPNCSTEQQGSWYNYSDWPQTIAFRRRILQTFFDTLSKTSIRDITIGNLQNVNDPELVTSDAFKTVMSRTSSLALDICTETCSYAIEPNDTMPELANFFRELPSLWLAPVAANLTHLTLHCDREFGFCPALDVDSIYLPSLSTLSLGNFSFASDKPVDWLIRHAATLRHLYLRNCPIIIYRTHDILEATMDEHAATMLPQGPTGRGSLARQRYFLSHLRWSTVFDRLNANLPALRDFRFNSRRWHRYGSDGTRAFARDMYYSMPNWLLLDRYALWSSGSSRPLGDSRGYQSFNRTVSKWSGGETEVGKEYMAFLERCGDGREQDREDAAALRRLLERVYGPIRPPDIMTRRTQQ